MLEKEASDPRPVSDLEKGHPGGAVNMMHKAKPTIHDYT